MSSGMVNTGRYVKHEVSRKKKNGQVKKLAQSPFSSALLCQRDLMYPQHIGPEC